MTQAWGRRVQHRRCTSRLQLSTMSLLLLQPTGSSGWVCTAALYLNSGYFFFFFTSRSGTIAYCQTIFMWVVLPCLDEGNYVCYVEEGPGGLAALNRHWHAFVHEGLLWCWGFFSIKKKVMTFLVGQYKQCCLSELKRLLLHCIALVDRQLQFKKIYASKAGFMMSKKIKNKKKGRS